MPFELYMRAAITEAEAALEMGEIPIGAVVECNKEIIARAHNLRETKRDPTAHAEILALRQAAEQIGAWRLSGCTLFVTLEPCPMCAGALVLARAERLVFGCDDPKAGATGTIYNITQDARLNHQLDVVGGILEKECREILQRFFDGRRP